MSDRSCATLRIGGTLDRQHYHAFLDALEQDLSRAIEPARTDETLLNDFRTEQGFLEIEIPECADGHPNCLPALNDLRLPWKLSYDECQGVYNAGVTYSTGTKRYSAIAYEGETFYTLSELIQLQKYGKNLGDAIASLTPPFNEPPAFVLTGDAPARPAVQARPSYGGFYP